MKKRIDPIEHYEEIIDDKALTISDIKSNTHYKNCHIEGIEETNKFDEVKFENCFFADKALLKLECLDVIFEKIDFSNVQFDESLFYRVRFANCKFIGTSFYKTKMKNVAFHESNLHYANVSLSNLTHVSFHNSDLSEASLQEVEHKELMFVKSNLDKVDLHDTVIKGLDLSSCEFDSLGIDLRDCRNVKIRYDQAVIIAKMLGFEIT
ncbi:uncharacterized protein YjbI with pentapeptide repeats [Breznakia sp. PF5-3]|uniref:pentapeptide repeat-containing protein n=1 Tax=unclassified Breznakia TaxID=2623764 RepID=UPI00240582DA|nr:MULTISPECIES: pentapeptide repeat-containing protein [unclassified Breznakia]MDF9824916.1 uncharacterized protein YjbI with pentapeptide repeats [Breznakia sp. PM6-1]MDF9835585.1 uncharacterized protein YjbI with pentapeptide repeats [Breznakia sp. PF5-3]MDF9837999.1 uncharacterized protein YjbI with pentapeptide repeats [Breznakia sp. PFB2-8]MDF9859988.1 uncharacterized protein YjbI with pentapeptide repeats [Breznakia sp. PH5-24]